MTRVEKKALHVQATLLLSRIDTTKRVFGEIDPEYAKREELCRMEEYDDIMEKLNNGAEVSPQVYY